MDAKANNDGEQFTRDGCYEAGLGGDVSKLADYYSKTAGTYEQFVDSIGYSCPQLVAKTVARVQPNKDARILDVAAGSGLLGEKLKEMGYSDVDALDASKGMLDLARSKGLYKSYICSLVLPDQKTPVPDNVYDVVSVCGGMSLGHVSPRTVPELIRMTKSGGSVVFSVDIHDDVVKNDPDFEMEKIEANLQALVDDGKCIKWTKEDVIIFPSGEKWPIYEVIAI